MNENAMYAAVIVVGILGAVLAGVLCLAFALGWELKVSRAFAIAFGSICFGFILATASTLATGVYSALAALVARSSVVLALAWLLSAMWRTRKNGR